LWLIVLTSKALNAPYQETVNCCMPVFELIASLMLTLISFFLV
jgi:hypothetical protein